MFNLATLQKKLLKPIIPVIKISGVINLDQYINRHRFALILFHGRTSKVALSLKQINPSRSKALAVVVNSPGKKQDSLNC